MSDETFLYILYVSSCAYSDLKYLHSKWTVAAFCTRRFTKTECQVSLVIKYTCTYIIRFLTGLDQFCRGMEYCLSCDYFCLCPSWFPLGLISLSFSDRPYTCNITQQKSVVQFWLAKVLDTLADGDNGVNRYPINDDCRKVCFPSYIRRITGSLPIWLLCDWHILPM